jgi:hypothetical protein
MGIKVPGATNNAKIDAGGHLEFEGTGTNFDDMNADALSVQVQGVGVSRDPAESCVTFATTADLNDYAYANFQFSHSRKNGADVYPHVHYWQDNDNLPNFLIQYRWQINGEAKDATWKNYPLDLAAFDWVSGTLVQIAYNSAGITPPAGDDVSSILQLRLYRDNDNDSGQFAGADPYTGSVSVVFIDVHYERDSVGSDLQYEK